MTNPDIVLGSDVNAAAVDGSTASMATAAKCHLEIVQYLAAEHGADANAADSDGLTALQTSSLDPSLCAHVLLFVYIVY